MEAAKPGRPHDFHPIRLAAGRTAAINFMGLLLLTGGCWGRGLPTKVIEGTVTFQGKAPPKSGEIFFAPLQIAADLPKRPAQGTFDETGKFSLTSWEPGDGVVPGTYQVTIICWRETPTLETKLSANFVPPDFVPEVTIDAKSREPVAVTIDVPRLQGKN